MKAILRQHKILLVSIHFLPETGHKNSPRYIGSKRLSAKAIFTKFQEDKHVDYAGTADYTRISEWAQLDLQSIQHRV